MPSLDLLVPFAVATLVFAITPGPAILYTAARTLAGGRAGGLMASLGIHLGGWVHVAAAALGLSAVFELVPDLYVAVKVAGAIYLVWLGVTMLRRRLDRAEMPTVGSRSARRAFVESVAVEVLNPKAALFYLAFLPQFADPAAALPIWGQLLVLGAIVNAAFSAADLVTVAFTSRMLSVVRRSSLAERVARWVAGSILMALGARLALARD